MFVEILIGLGKDLELWIKEIFIKRDAQDIHYFDASFANNCLELEIIFHKNELEESADDLEFF